MKERLDKVMRFRRWFIMGGLVWIAAISGVLAEAPPMDRETAYRHLRRAEDAQLRNDWAAAVQDLHMADAMYRVLIRTAPDWEQDYFRFRMESCERQLRMIERRSGVARAEWMDREPQHSPLRVDRYRVLYHALRVENEALQQRVAQLEEEVELLLEMEEIEQARDARRQTNEVPSPVLATPPPVVQSPVVVPNAEVTAEEPAQPESRPAFPVLRERRPLPRF